MNTADIQTSHKITSVLWKRRKKICHQFRSVQSLSHLWLFATLYSTPGFIVHHQLPELAQTHVQWVDDAIQPSHPLSSPSSDAETDQRLFWCWEESVLHIRWPKYWSFSFSISPCNEYSGLLSFTIDWFDLLAVKWTLKSFLQHHSSKAPILRYSAFFIVQLSHPYTTTGKNHSLD